MGLDDFKAQKTSVVDEDLLVIEVLDSMNLNVFSFAIHEMSHVVSFIGGGPYGRTFELEDMIELSRRYIKELRKWAEDQNYEYGPPNTTDFSKPVIKKTYFTADDRIVDEKNRTLFLFRKEPSDGKSKLLAECMLDEWIEAGSLLESLTAAQAALAQK